MYFILSDIELMYLTERKVFGGDFCQTETNQKTQNKTIYRSSITKFQYRTSLHSRMNPHFVASHLVFMSIFATSGRTEWGRSQGYTKKMHGFIHIWMYSFGVHTCSVFKRTSGFIMRSTQIFVHESQ